MLGQAFAQVRPWRNAGDAKEDGVFPFVREVVWKVEDWATLPALFYRTRYIYAFDPLEFGHPNQLNNLYYLVEQKELVDSALLLSA